MESKVEIKGKEGTNIGYILILFFTGRDIEGSVESLN